MKELIEELERWGADVIFGRARGFRASLDALPDAGALGHFPRPRANPPLALPQRLETAAPPRLPGRGHRQHHGGRHRQDPGGGVARPLPARPGTQRRHSLARLQKQETRPARSAGAMPRTARSPPSACPRSSPPARRCCWIPSSPATSHSCSPAISTGVSVVVDKNRVKGGRFAIEHLDPRTPCCWTTACSIWISRTASTSCWWMPARPSAPRRCCRAAPARAAEKPAPRELYPSHQMRRQSQRRR
jgi:tetraacyldisaccharide 4'-kinase